MLVVSACGAASQVQGPASHEVRTITVEVVNARGEPLVGAEVEGVVEVNPGPVASTCCTQERFALEDTSDDGRATLTDALFTFRAYQLHVSYNDWPPRLVTVRSVLGSAGVVRVVLGPAREVSGRVDWGSDCTPSKEPLVSALPSGTRAKVNPDGTFFFSSLPPWASLSIEACGRSARHDLEVGDNRPVVLTLPQSVLP